jgi:hypothetical protein
MKRGIMGAMGPRKTPYTPKHAPPEQPLLFERHQVAHTDAKDFYPTPVPEGVRAIRGFCWDPVDAVVLDPSCGHGNLLEAARLAGARRTLGLELSEELASMASRKGHMVARVDALAVEWPRADFLIGNPPFSLGLAFATRAAEWAARYDRPAAMLLELDFLSSQQRRALHHTHPAKAHILSERISFMGGDGQTAKRNYMWLGWGVGFDPWTYEVW